VTEQPTAPATLTGTASQEVDAKAYKALWGSAIGFAIDGFDLMILSFMLRAISGDLGLSQAQGASLITATLIGAVFGGIGFGMLSDRLGRVRVLTWTIVIYAVFTGLCALAQGYWDLLATAPLPASALAMSSASAWPSSPRPGRRASAPEPHPMSASVGRPVFSLPRW
jgi:MFS family permease